MEQGFLIDANAVIDYLANKLPVSGEAFLDNLPPIISVITRIEVLGWYNATPQQIKKLLPFISNATVYPLDEPVIQRTILLRQSYKIKTPDAIIAATTLEYGLTLITRNTDDFKNIEGLKLLNPYDIHK